MIRIVQIDHDDVERSSTLEAEDAGKWCLLINGAYQGFWDTYEEAAKAKAGLESHG